MSDRYGECTLGEKDILLDYYKKGYTVEAIQEVMGISNEEVLSHLNEYRISQKVNKRYSDEMMQLIAERDSYDFKRKDIMAELGVSRNFLARAIEEHGFLSKTTKEDGEEFFMDIPLGFEIDTCPKCESHNINEVETVYGDSPTQGYYCINCGSEFLIRGEELYIVKWENID